MLGRLWRVLIAGPPHLALVLIVVLATYLWAPTLFAGEVILHGESFRLSTPLLAFHARALAGEGPLLWTAGLYGGHPLFAEGQGGFAHPLNIFAAGVLVPALGLLPAKAVLGWAITVIGGVGVAGLARSLGIGPWGAALAAIAAAFSTSWVTFYANIAVCNAIAWTPWALWAMEAWIKRPTLLQGLVLGAACSAVFLAGYPLFLHGLALYMAMSLLPTFIFPRHWHGAVARLTSGALAVVFFLGASAVQWAPMLELVGQSHRADGTQLSLTMLPDLVGRGALFSIPEGAYRDLRIIPFIGSALVCVLATIGIVGRSSHRLVGHFAATVLLTLIGGTFNPFFGFVYEHGLIPGLNYFRIVVGYLTLAVIGAGVLAGAALDVLGRPVGAWRSLLVNWRLWIGVAAVCAWIWLGADLDDGRLPRLTQWILLLGLLSTIVLAAARRSQFLPLVLCVFVLIEAASLRPASLPTFSADPLSMPASVSDLRARQGTVQYRVMPPPPAGIMTSPYEERFARTYACTRESLQPATNLYWGVRSIDGPLALPLARRMLIEPILREELVSEDKRAGLRLIDLLAVRFVMPSRPTSAPAIQRLSSRPCSFFENTAARPLVQVYEGHARARAPEQALALLQAAEAPTLVLEPAADGTPPPPALARGEPDARVEIVQMSDERYVLRVTSARAAWLFLADANYPGWRATVDGAPAPVFTAQVLGKAVAAPAGEHEIVIWFRSDSVQIGLAVTVMTILLTLAWLGWRLRRLLRA